MFRKNEIEHLTHDIEQIFKFNFLENFFFSFFFLDEKNVFYIFLLTFTCRIICWISRYLIWKFFKINFVWKWSVKRENYYFDLFLHVGSSSGAVLNVISFVNYFSIFHIIMKSMFKIKLFSQFSFKEFCISIIYTMILTHTTNWIQILYLLSYPKVKKHLNAREANWWMCNLVSIMEKKIEKNIMDNSTLMILFFYR